MTVAACIRRRLVLYIETLETGLDAICRQLRVDRACCHKDPLSAGFSLLPTVLRHRIH